MSGVDVIVAGQSARDLVGPATMTSGSRPRLASGAPARHLDLVTGRRAGAPGAGPISA